MRGKKMETETCKVFECNSIYKELAKGLGDLPQPIFIEQRLSELLIRHLADSVINSEYYSHNDPEGIFRKALWGHTGVFFNLNELASDNEEMFAIDGYFATRLYMRFYDCLEDGYYYEFVESVKNLLEQAAIHVDPSRSIFDSTNPIFEERLITIIWGTFLAACNDRFMNDIGIDLCEETMDFVTECVCALPTKII